MTITTRVTESPTTRLVTTITIGRQKTNLAIRKAKYMISTRPGPGHDWSEEQTAEQMAKALDIKESTFLRRCLQVSNGTSHIKSLMKPKSHRKYPGFRIVAEKMTPLEMCSERWRIALSLGMTRNGIVEIPDVTL